MQYRINFKKKTSKFYKDDRLPLWISVPFNIVFVLLIIISIVTAIYSIIYIRTDVEGESMQPTINVDWTETNKVRDTVLVNRFNKGERGDIIVIEKEENVENKFIIKRIIALGGDKICIKQILDGGQILNYEIWLINKDESTAYKLEDPFGHQMHNTYTKFQNLKNNPNLNFIEIDGDFYLKVPDDSVFYLGDNRGNSVDSATNGPIKATQIIGKVELIIKHDQDFFTTCFNFFIRKIFFSI